MNPAPLCLTVEHLQCGYGKRPVLHDISFSLAGGTLSALLGANGCGKTTLLKALCGQLPHTGSCLLQQTPLASLNNRKLSRLISYIPQRSGVSLSLSLLDVVLMGFNPVLGLLEQPSAAQRERAAKALAMVGLKDREQEDFLTLSEGQKQLCILARTFVEDTKLLLLDEPDSALDYPNRYGVLRRLRDLCLQNGRTGLLSLHDPNLALEFCQQLILIKDGRCSAILRPRTDSLARMEEGFSEIYGKVALEHCRGRLVLLP